MNTDANEDEDGGTFFTLRQSDAPARNRAATQLSVFIRVPPWFNFGVWD